MFTRIAKNFKKRWKLILIIIAVLAAVGFWFYRKNNTKEESLTFITPEKGNLVKTIEVSGNIQAKQSSKLRFAAGGKITYIGAKEGDFVKKGQTIAAIDQKSLQKNLEKSLNDYSKERIDWDQTLDNTKDRWLPKPEDRTKQKDQIDLNNTIVNVELNDIAIQNTVLAAPFDGVLISSPTNVTGVTLLSTDTFDVVNPDTLYFQAQVDELDIGQIQKGQTATLAFDAYPDETFSSSISYISYKSSQTSTSTVFLVDFPLTSQDINKFRLGMNGDAKIVVDSKQDVLSVPIDATIERDGKTFVKVKTDEMHAEEKEIQTGLETEDRIEVKSGLSQNDQIVLPQ